MTNATDDENSIEENGFLPPDVTIDDTKASDEKIMTWIEHLSEMRSRLLATAVFFVVAFAAAYPFAGHVLDVLIIPLSAAMKIEGGTRRVIFTSLTEGFLTRLTLAGFAAVFLTFPFFLFQVWQYVRPALYPRERQSVLFILFASPFLFLTGGAFVFFVVMPAAFRFLLSFQNLSQTDAVLPVVIGNFIAGAIISVLAAIIIALSPDLYTAERVLNGVLYGLFVLAAVMLVIVIVKISRKKKSTAEEK